MYYLEFQGLSWSLITLFHCSFLLWLVDPLPSVTSKDTRNLPFCFLHYLFEDQLFCSCCPFLSVIHLIFLKSLDFFSYWYREKFIFQRFCGESPLSERPVSSDLSWIWFPEPADSEFQRFSGASLGGTFHICSRTLPPIEWFLCYTNSSLTNVFKNYVHVTVIYVA